MSQSAPRFFAVATLLAALSTGCVDTEEVSDTDIAGLPSAGHYHDGDSWWNPTDRGTMLVGEQRVGDFDAEAGWISYEIQLTAGEVDIDAAEFNAGSNSDLDTILLVMGPQDAYGRFGRPIAYNDDVVPGENLNSFLRLDAPADGLYRIVVSTYPNLYFFPFNVSDGTYQLTVKCPRGPEACGPAGQR